jgi:hypothetical protein
VTDNYAKHRLAELHAAAPAKRKKVKLFAVVELDEVAKAFAAVKCGKAMVYIWLLQQARKTGNNTVAMPNGTLAKYGVSRKVKYLALQRYEKAGMITVAWHLRKTPVVTLLRP